MKPLMTLDDVRFLQSQAQSTECPCPVCPQCDRPGYEMPECGFNMGADHTALSEWHAAGHPMEPGALGPEGGWPDEGYE